MRKTEKHINVSNLLWKYLNDDLSEQEKKELDILFKENVEFKIWFDEFKTQEHIDKRLEEYFSIDIKNKWKQFEPRIKQKAKLRKLARYLLKAASILLPVAMVVYLIFEMDLNFSGNRSKIMPGTSKAILTLSDGQKVSLNQNNVDTIYDFGNQINSTGSDLKYVNTEDEKKTDRFEKNTLDVPRGGEFRITLNDGTKVWLNSDSKLTYLVPFGQKNRIVELSGEAYFEVAHNEDLPFIVRTENGLVTALGTSFNVRSYKDEAYTVTTLAEGKVALNMGHLETEYLNPGQQASFNLYNQSMTVNEVDVKRFLLWKEGQFMFVDTRLEDIIRDLSRWYDFEVFYENESAKDLLFTFYLSRDKKIDKILELLQRTKGVNFDVSEKHVVVKKK